MLTNAIVAHGIALDTARITGHVVLLWRKRRDTDGDIEIDAGMSVNTTDIPEGAVMYARYKPDEAVKHLIRMSMAVPWCGVACLAAKDDAIKHDTPQTVWALADAVGGGFMSCHPSIELDKQHKRILYVP